VFSRGLLGNDKALGKSISFGALRPSMEDVPYVCRLGFVVLIRLTLFSIPAPLSSVDDSLVGERDGVRVSGSLIRYDMMVKRTSLLSVEMYWRLLYLVIPCLMRLLTRHCRAIPCWGALSVSL